MRQQLKVPACHVKAAKDKFQITKNKSQTNSNTQKTMPETGLFVFWVLKFGAYLFFGACYL
jgi:hypothetical protein